MLRVLVGQNDLRERLERTCRTGGTWTWIVPKDSEPGDSVVILFNRHEFVATGKVLSSPEHGKHGKRKTYKADIGRLKLLPSPVSLEEVAEQIPDWNWPKYPKSFTTPNPAVAAQLLRIFAGRRRTDVEPLKERRPSSKLSFEEGLGRESRTFRYPRSMRLRTEALRVAKGLCEACGRNFTTLLDGRGLRVLQVHHRHQRSLDSIPRVTTLSDLAVLCANCHALVHINPESAMPVEALRKLLEGDQQA